MVAVLSVRRSVGRINSKHKTTNLCELCDIAVNKIALVNELSGDLPHLTNFMLRPAKIGHENARADFNRFT